MRDILNQLGDLDSDLVDEMVPFNKAHFGGSDFITILDESDLETLSELTLMERYEKQILYDQVIPEEHNENEKNLKEEEESLKKEIES